MKDQPNNSQNPTSKEQDSSMAPPPFQLMSDQPDETEGNAYAQGTDIHIGPGQEKHLPHEAWHVVQQKQGRVKPTEQTEDDE